ncbi:Protein LSD1 [Morella rubra]|uniref:Protein LSD1 n=1 Tax=Morella rubra TaxID=262757 RepID=A0A6A1UMN3_9ROSI|nr:Protein LSD1 [Morella rubra]
MSEHIFVNSKSLIKFLNLYINDCCVLEKCYDKQRQLICSFTDFSCFAFCDYYFLKKVPGQVAHVNCANCRTTLMYPYGAPSVKCAVCHYVTNVGMGNTRVPIPVHRPNGTANSGATTSTAIPSSQSQTVVVENPMTVDESGKLVSNVVVGVTTDKK